jgi:UDP-glucose:glycoprotein glucosyltransferase
VAENIFHIVFPVDLTNSEDLLVISQVHSLMRRGIPVRFGLVPLIPSEEAGIHTKVAYHFATTYGVDALVGYLRGFASEFDPAKIEQQFVDMVKRIGDTSDDHPTTLSGVIEQETYTQRVKAAQKWSQRLNTNTAARSIFVNGLVLPRSAQWMQTVSTTLAEDLQALQMALLGGEANSIEWLPDFFLERASAKRNIYISPGDSGGLQILDINKAYSDHADLFTKVPVLESSPDAEKETWAVLTVVADLTSQSGRDFLAAGLAFWRDNPGVRLDIVHNPEVDTDAGKTNAVIKSHQDQLGRIESADDLARIVNDSETAGDDGFAPALRGFLVFAKIQAGSQVLILNGRVIGPISPEDVFGKEDFQQLLEFEHAHRIRPVYEAIEDLGLTDTISSPLAAAKVTSVTALSSISDLPEGIFEAAPTVRTNLYDEWKSAHTAIEIGDPETASVHIAGLLNPLSERGQRWAPILKILSELDGVYMKLFLNPKDKIEELPVKRFYRYVLGAKPSFDAQGSLQALNATFKGLPSETLLTAGINVPPAWLVAAKASVHDLDNIKLSSIKNDVEAMYELSTS